MSEDRLPFSVTYQALSTESGKKITLVFEEDKFASFITRLLGQPQKIRRTFPATFAVDHEWFNNLHLLLMQRIGRQNKYTQVQFSAQIFFQDGLVRTLNSVEAFINFAEVHPLISIGCQMTWTFLVSFTDKEAPEKQQITITVMSATNNNKRNGDFVEGDDEGGSVDLEIDHTERTWGDDILAIILAHVNSRVKHKTPVRRWVNKNALNIGMR